MSRSYRRYSTDFKWALVQEVVVGRRSVRSVAAEGGVRRTLLMYWLQKHARGDFNDAFDPRYNSGLLYQRINALEATVTELRAQIERLTSDDLSAPVSEFDPAPPFRVARVRRVSNGA